MTETVQRLAQRLAGLAARRSGLVVGLWGEAGIGKTHTSSALLRSTLCPSLSVHATQASEGIIGAVPRPKKPPVWLERSLERSRCGEPLEPSVFVQTLAGLLSANAPVILHVEDLHEAAPERLEVWKQLASAVTRTRGVGVIATSRTQPPDGFESVRLEPLRRVASDALLEAEAGTALPVEACSWIFEHARGNPLFTLEFFRFLARHGFVWNDGQRWRWRTPERQVMPVTVEAIIERIINEACADIATRTALNARAYLESLEPNLSFGFEVWAHVAGLELALLERSERNLRAWGVLSELGFVHPLFREVGGKGLNVHERRSFANRALEVLPIRVAAVFVTDAKLGDGGYYYVPADYVEQTFKSLDVLNFDARRSDAWKKEQTTPGSSEAPGIQIITNPASLDVRVETNLASFFKVTHSVAASVNLTVTSSVDGVLYNGSWSTNKNLIAGTELRRALATQGSRTLSLVASYAGNQTQASLNVNALNTAPTLSLQFGATANQSVAFPITAIVGDINEPDPSALCANTTWAVDAPDSLSSASGCSVSVTFGTTGGRQVRVSTRDREGLSRSFTQTLAVQPPPANPYPILDLFLMRSRELFLGDGICSNMNVSQGNTIDISQLGCAATGQPLPRRYFARTRANNPSGETLTYDWKLYVGSGVNETVHISTNGSSLDTFDLYTPNNNGETTSACRVTVKVNAPEASRSKGPFTVWSGQCTYYTFRVN